MANTEGVNIVISGDSSQLVRSVKEAQSALSSMKNRKIDIAVQITGGLQEAGAKIESLFGSIFKTITAGAMSVAGALSMVTKSALSIGGGFEAQITNVKVISGATEQELDMLIKKAREMGATLPITAKDAATAMQLLAQRGTSAKDILASVSEVANLTISQGVDMGSAADLLGSTMTNFGISVNDASKITAIFNNACNQSALSMSKMIEAMKYIGPAAGAVDMSLTETVAAMEAIANAGLTGEMTGTGLAMVLSKLASKSQIMGVRTKELDGSMRPLKDIFVELKNTGFSLTEAIEAFGARGSKAALALAKNSESLEKNEERLKKWGSTQAAVDAKSKTFTNTVAALRSAVEEFHIEIFEQIKDQSKEAVGGVAELTRAFSKWVGETQIAGKSLNAFLQGLGFNIPAVNDFQSLLKQFDVQSFINKVKDFGSTLKQIGESIASVFNKIKTPLSWLIEHLDTFAQISFWGWILGKGLQIPAAILGIASSFISLASSVKGLLGLSWASLAGLLTNPITAGVALAGVGIYAASRMDAANEQLRKAIDEEKHYLEEQSKADLMLPVDIQFDFKTGFEKLPESWTKASDKVREEVNVTVKELQEQFRIKAALAIEHVTAKFPDMADAIKNMGAISDSALRQISSALHGDEKAFEAMPDHLRMVTEHINAMNIAAGEGGTQLFGMFNKYKQLRQEVEKPVKKDEGASFFDSFTASLNSIVTELPAEIERANKFLSGSDGQLAVQLSFAQAQSKLDKFVKSASKEYSIDKDIVQVSVFHELERLAQAGNNTAQSLINGWNSAGNSLDTFLADAKDAITYLEVSPDKFMPALNSMMKGIQKIDPLTGKVTEQFKKAHDALKQWSNVSFGQLENRLQKLRKAYEGGFINEIAWKAELKRAIPQIKLQVVNDLQPQREQYRNERDYKAVIASEFTSRIEALFGDFGLNMIRNMFNGKTGSEIGYSIAAEVERKLSGSSGTFQINGVDKLQKGLDSIATLPQNIANAINLPQVKTDTRTVRDETDYSASIEQAVQGIYNISSGVQEVTAAVNNGVNALISTAVSVINPATGETVDFQNVISALSDNTSALGRASEAVLNLVNPAGNVPQNISYNTNADFPQDFYSVIKEFQGLNDNIDALKKSTDGNISAITQLQTSLTSSAISSDNQDFISALAPLTGAVQNLSAALNTIQTIQQANSSAIGEVINAVRSVENALKSINAGNNYDIDINQQGFVIEKKSDADMLARSTFNALRSGIGNGGL